jgi:hypothetical protein
VLLGPFYEQESVQSTAEALDRVGLNHFERPES